MKPILLTLLSCLVLTGSAVHADNWAHWRGPEGNGTAPGATPPAAFSSTQNVKWKVEVPGKGSGSPLIWEDKVVVTAAVPAGRGQQFTVLCYSRATGDLLWKKVANEAVPHQGTHQTNNYASASPCTDGEHIYAYFGSFGLYCYTMDGDLVWKRDDMGRMNVLNNFGEGSSPVLADDVVLIQWDHQGPSSLYAINKTTGKTVWQTPRDEPSTWGTPLVVEHNGKKQVITGGQNNAHGYDLATGEHLWWCGGQTFRPASSPVQLGDMVMVGSGFQGAFMGAFRLDGQGDIEGTSSVVWTTNRDTTDIASPLLSNGRLYFYKGKGGQLTCLDAKTGQAHYRARRIPGISSTYASPVAAGGNIYLSDRSGRIVVIKDSENFEIVATNNMGETVDATPAPVDDQLFIRGERHLFCIEAN